MKRATGYILLETPNIVIIATLKTSNPKTGNMVQIWILNRDVNPVEAVKSGQDDVVCFNCPMRGNGDGTGRICYVRVAQAPLAVWKTYQAGKYERLSHSHSTYKTVFAGRKIRFGAYGEPVLIPHAMMADLFFASEGTTGYTHQWREAEYQPYKVFLMASVDTPQEQTQAQAMGWRTFRSRTADQPMAASEIMCPASDEAGHKTTCEDCRLCNGTYANDPRKNISIVVHGSGAKNFVSLASIA